jgi:uncharacterized protein (TIGR02996 family)
MAIEKEVVAAVIAARKAWAPRRAEHEAARRQLFEQGYGGEAWREFAQGALGIARHPVTSGSWWCVPNGSVRKCLEAASDELGAEAWRAVSARCVEAFFDGYALGTALHGGARGKGRTFSSGQQLARFETQAIAGAPALVEALGPALDSLLPSLSEVPPAKRADAAVAVRLAVVMGLLLHQYEFGWKDALARAVATARSRRRAEARAEPAPVHLPPNPDLLAAVLAAPDDDAPRQVYADWLMERGDPRGEFIALQLKLGRTLAGARARWASATGLTESAVKRLKEREVELIKRYEKVWIPRTRCFRAWAWRRGFLSSVLADVAKFTRDVGSVAGIPLESVKLTGFRPEHLKTVLAADVHPTLRSFDFSSNRLNARTAGVLAAPLFGRARGLDLWGNDFSTPAATEVLAAIDLPRLERLSLCGTKLTDESLARLAEGRFFPRLTHLDLRFNRALTPGGLAVLRKAKALRWVGAFGTQASDRAHLAALLPAGAQVQLTADDPAAELGDFG